MLIKRLKGLKYPDDYIIRFFFKEGLDERKGTVIELGCGNGNNLSLFYQYGWDVTGVDASEDAVKKANDNFTMIQGSYMLKNKFKFYKEDMVKFVKRYQGKPFDVVLLPNSIYYIDCKNIESLFKGIKDRYGRGRPHEDKSFILDIGETDEKGLLMTFLEEADILNILEKNYTLADKKIFNAEYDNIQNNHMIHNSDVIFWCKVDRVKK